MSDSGGATVIPFGTARRRADRAKAPEAVTPPRPVSRIDPLAQLFEAPQAPAERRRVVDPEPVVPRESTKLRNKPRSKRVNPVIHQAIDTALEHLGRLDSETMSETEQTLASALRQLAIAVMHAAKDGNA